MRLNVYPDGGVSRLRVWGRATEAGIRAAAVTRINTLLDLRELHRVCGSARWVEEFAKKRPFQSWEEMIDAAQKLWLKLDEGDWLEAFSAHPRIGERKAGWSQQEQSGTRGAVSETMNALADANRAYEEKFGFIYLVCATGRSADDMLANCRQRQSNDRATELRNAAEEQAKIIALRLEKLVL